MAKADSIREQREAAAKAREVRAKRPRGLCGACGQLVVLRDDGTPETHPTAPLLRNICNGAPPAAQVRPAPSKPSVTKPETPRSKKK